ncbi:MAG: hypothetical protein HY513_00650 [Candidatus Aenigmarchaeota archaeon]|nr:hypothetical protein [Candidatus Aenigmarchaeota archaeon]
MQKKDGTFKNEEDFKKKMGMTPLEFARFIRTKTAKEIDAELRRRKKLK